MELITALILILTTACDAAFVYDHMEMVVEWPPTFCGMANINCIASISKMQFLIHGLWPADHKGNSRQKCPPPPDPNAVKQVWENDRNLKKDLDTFWPTLLAGKTNESLWMHEWKVHGYCTKNTVSAPDYFRGGIRFAKKPYMMKMLTSLISGQMAPTNHRTYTVTAMKTFISKYVLKNKNYQVYISCKPANASFVFLRRIHFCLDRMLKTFISCPPSPDTRGCGGPNLQNHLIFPTRAIYN